MYVYLKVEALKSVILQPPLSVVLLDLALVTMTRKKAVTYGEIADTVLPSVVLTVDTLNALSGCVDSYVKLAPRDRPAFLQEQMEEIWPTAIDWASRPRTDEFKSQWSVSPSFLFSAPTSRWGMTLKVIDLGFATVLPGARSYSSTACLTHEYYWTQMDGFESLRCRLPRLY